MISQLKQQIKLIESILTEGDHWPEDYRRKAINRIKLATAGKTPTYSENDIEADVNQIISKFEPLSHKNSNLGYFLPIIRMFIDYTRNDQSKRKEFVDNKTDMLIKNLDIISQDPSLESKFKDDIKQKWSLEDFEKHAAEIQAEINKADADTLASVDTANTSDYDIIPIDSYEELHEKFGGDKTGYEGKSEWCHTNGASTYDSWTDGDTKRFFVLAKKGWENIQPPDPITTNAFDDYGTSLIAILVKVETGELLNATLRWNHIIEPGKTVPKTSVDRAFLGWGDLSKVVGFNVKDVIEKEQLKKYQNDLKNKIEKANKAIFDKLKTVTEIDADIISDKPSLTHIEIPDNITSIGEYAFNGCSNLTSITIPKSVKSIGKFAFADCSGLTNVTIPNSVTSIGGYAFIDCWGLRGVTIPKSVKRIGHYAFKDCSLLKSITIPDSVTNLGYGAFGGCQSLTNVTISNRLTYIGNSMFKECSSLESVTIPDSVKTINDFAFYGCEGLTSVTLGNSVTGIYDRTFSECYRLRSITIPDSVKWIGYRAFSNCDGLTSVTIGNGVTNIDDEAFDGCAKLTSVTFKGKTLDEVRSMKDYPWGIKNPKSSIKSDV